MRNKRKGYQPNNFERWILSIEFLQQETQAVNSPSLLGRSGEAVFII